MGEWLTSWWGAPWRTSSRRRTIGSVVVSSLMHASLLASCAYWMFAIAPDPPMVSIRTAWDASPPPEVATLEPLPVNVTPDESETGGTSLGEAVFHETDGDSSESVALDVASLSSLLDTTGQLPTATVETQTVGLAGGQGQGVATGSGRGDGTGKGEGDDAGTGFFGLTIEGRRVVYVVDASRSMNKPHPGPMKTRFGRVKLELVRSIGAMTPEQEFFIVYFNDQAWPMPSATLRLAVPSVRHKYLRWAVEAKASGTTNPEQALLIALTLKPDVIYFLTDGAFHSNVIDRVRIANNRSRVTIHTIGFGDDDGESLLKEIAFQNWGTYQFIPGDESAESDSSP